MAMLDKMQKDSLTLCYRKEFLVPYLKESRAEYAAFRKLFSVLLIDIDGFKSINDKRGHVFGDEALRYFSSSLRLSLESDDSAIFRFGGDEFIIVFPGRTSKESYRLAVNIGNNIKNRPFLFRGHEYRISFSGGIASCPEDSLDIDEIIEKADKAMYFSKKCGRGKVAQYSQIRFRFIGRLMRFAIWSLVIAAAITAASHVFHVDLQSMRYKLGSPWMKNSASKMPRTVRIYLRSGNPIEGIITGESDNDITLKFNMATGEGSVVIKKSDIKQIDRGYK